jgi:hypothetical protein
MFASCHLKAQPYDWYRSEKNGMSLIEKGKRKLSEKVFLEETLREVRAAAHNPACRYRRRAAPNGRVTIAATHLEKPHRIQNRVKQLEELLIC